MRSIIFRDDDTSYFTRPDQLQAIYGRLWEAGHPVCLAVVPYVYGDIRVYWRDGNPFDPGVPPQYRGKDEYFSILDNPALCEFLHEKAQAGLVEICLHGYSHTFYEFITHDASLISQKLDAGLSILHDAFPDIPIKTFIAPYDRLSPNVITEILNRSFNLSTQSTNLPPLPHLPQISGHQKAIVNDTQMLYVCDNYFFTHRDDPEQSKTSATSFIAEHDFTIITSHYWMFYFDWNLTPDKHTMNNWNMLLDDVLADKSLQIVPFHLVSDSAGINLTSKLNK